ncbi:hypothetical protein QR685DRAFT_276374 [Neurospora intermedia]|uniref:Uncharacterized protein n=1 Tax=Neurospora intermedia TaxID=5142 RepID=A0ABR3DES2_NEUIN
MLPPIDSSVLKNNPQFANLYKSLTELVLNDDGSTKLHPQNPVAQERKAVTDELNKHRLAATTENLLIHALSTTSPDPIPISTESEFNQNLSLSSGLTIPPSLKQPLTDLLLLLPSFLSLDFSSPETPPLDSDSLSLILTSPPLSLLPTLLPYLGPLLSTTLHSQASHLVHLAAHLSHPSMTTGTTSSSNLTTPPLTNLTIPHLPTTISHLTTFTLPTLYSSVLHARLDTAKSVRDLLAQYSTAYTLLIKTLEAKHGTIARSLEFKASETALLAQKAEKESELAVLGVRREVYTPEVKRALVEYKKWLVAEQERIRGEIERGEEVLGGYGVRINTEGGGEGGGDAEKEKVMREIARVYGEMEREVDVVRKDLERLGFGRGE